MTTFDLPPAPADALRALRQRIRGEVVVRGDDTHEHHAAAWNLLHRHDPEVIVVPADAGDVATAVRFAAETGLGLGVQATGHGPVLPVDGVLVDTRRLDTLRVDPVRQTAHVGAGCRWAPVLAAAQEHGLAPLVGSSSDVGAVGYSLGGGLGWLARRHGPACDSVVAFDVVTPDGRLVRADDRENTPLFRALRGGGGGAIGVVTAMEIRLVPVTTVYAGDLLYPAGDAAELAVRWAEWARHTPAELTSSVVFMNFPPAPDVPDALRGQSFTIVRGCWSGDTEDGRTLLDSWRAAAPPIADTWRVMPFAENDRISNDPVSPLPAVARGAWLDRVDDDVARILATGTAPGTPLLFTEIRHVSGAVRPDSTAVMAGADRDFVVHSIGVPGPCTSEEIVRHADAMYGALASAASGEVPLNFVDGDERRRHSAAGVARNERAAVAAVQRRFDPHHVLRFGVHHTA